jgi:hypothetical protein
VYNDATGSEGVKSCLMALAVELVAPPSSSVDVFDAMSSACSALTPGAHLLTFQYASRSSAGILSSMAAVPAVAASVAPLLLVGASTGHGGANGAGDWQWVDNSNASVINRRPSDVWCAGQPKWVACELFAAPFTTRTDCLMICDQQSRRCSLVSGSGVVRPCERLPAKRAARAGVSRDFRDL